MKRWIVPILFAVAFHWALYRFDLIALPPVMAMPENRTVTISLVQMRPVSKPRPRVQPLQVRPPDPIAPLEPLAPKPRPVPPPEPLPIPEPVKAEPPPAPVEPAVDASETPPDETLQYPTTEERISAPAGPDQAEVQASTPLYHLNPSPAYPAVARRRNYQGTVLLDVLVDRQGRVADIKVAESCGYAVLDRSARKSVRQWRFEPGRRFGKPVEMWVQVPIKYELK